MANHSKEIKKKESRRKKLEGVTRKGVLWEKGSMMMMMEE
jgi:hypothetical protein